MSAMHVPMPGVSAVALRRRMFVWPVLAVLCAIPGCTRQDQSQVQQQTRQATDDTRAAAKNLKAETRDGLQKAENAVDAAADGVKQGIHDNVKANPDNASSGTTSSGQMDLNSASKAQLMTLPGITRAKADAIVANRPYATPDDTVSKHVLTEPQFDRIASQVAAK